MRRVALICFVALGMVATACGAGAPDTAEVWAGPRPSPVARDPLPNRAGAPDLAGALTGPGTPRPALAPQASPALSVEARTSAAAEAVNPATGPVPPPPTGPVVPRPAGPVLPGDSPSHQTNVLFATIAPVVSPAVADMPVRVYVPNSDAHTITVIDPATLAVVDRYAVGTVPHHVTPSHDMTKLYVSNTSGNTMTVLDPRTGKASQTLSIVDPYNLYFTPDGSKAIVVAERMQRLDYRDPVTWALIKSVSVPWAGVDHLDFSADGRYLIASCEFTGQVVKVDNEKMEVVGRAHVGSLPIDVKMSPDGSVFYVANQGRHGVSVIDPETMTEIQFIPTGTGAHGLNFSRDTTKLFVSNRLAGSISVIDVATRQVTATWRVGGSPDMLNVSTDGNQLWMSNRFHGSVTVIDANNGSVIKTIATGAGAHGVTFYPQPGRFSVGHNGVYR